MCYPIIVAALLGITAGQAGVKNLRRVFSLMSSLQEAELNLPHELGRFLSATCRS